MAYQEKVEEVLALCFSFVKNKMLMCLLSWEEPAGSMMTGYKWHGRDSSNVSWGYGLGVTFCLVWYSVTWAGAWSLPLVL